VDVRLFRQLWRVAVFSRHVASEPLPAPGRTDALPVRRPTGHRARRGSAQLMEVTVPQMAQMVASARTAPVLRT